MYLVTGSLGSMLLVTPFIFGYSQNSVATWTSMILGGAVIFASFIEGVDKDKGQWEYKAVEVVGLIVIAAPFILGFNSIIETMWVGIVIGISLSLISSFRLYYDQPDQINFEPTDKYFGSRESVR